VRLRRPVAWLVLLLSLALAAALPTSGASAGDEPAQAPPAEPAPPANIDPETLDPTDPVRLRIRLLSEMDAQIRADAARRHLEARLMLDRVLPVAYLGVDAEPAEGGMRLLKVYPDTGALAAGLREGDLVWSVGGHAVDSMASMGRAVRRHHVGDEVEIRFRRDGAERVVTAAFSKRIEEDEDEDEQYPELASTGAKNTGPVSFAFEGPAGSAPPGLIPMLGGHGAPPRFEVSKEGDASFLRQTADDRTGIRFPMAVVKDTILGDGVVRVRFRFAGGEQDRAAGVMLHFQNEANYLVARANAVEEDLRIFRTVNGIRRTLPDGRATGVPVDDAWHVLEFRAEGAKLTATVDGTIEVVAYDTYLPAGRVGLWTKSDAVSDFDDLEVRPAPPKEEKSE
jgi:hypothetical protein